ncbi:hypothetical protein DF19_25150 [Streptomyces olindensis]|nr:hypothetical protein DF19_25150 [Streptomyces olindensis]
MQQHTMIPPVALGSSGHLPAIVAQAAERADRPSSSVGSTSGLTAAVQAIVTELLRAHLDAQQGPAVPAQTAAYAAIAEGVTRAELAVAQERRPATYAATSPEQDYADHLFGEGMSALARAIEADPDPATAAETFATWARLTADGATE